MTEPSKALLDAVALRPAGTVLVLLSTGADRRWAADAAIDLSARWAAGGRRIVLADLHFETPLLHSGLDVSNLEGVVDVFLYGASLARIAKPVRDGSFYLIPAGTYAPDAEEIYRHPRWRKLVAGFQETDATLLLFAPAESADLDALSRWASEAIVLGRLDDGALGDRLADASMRVLAVIQPPAAADGSGTAEGAFAGGEAALAGAAPSRTAALSTGEPPHDEAATAGLDLPYVVDEEPESAAPPLVDERSVADLGEPPPGPASDLRPAVQLHRPPESELELPPPPVRRRPERRSTSILLWLLFVLILLGTIGYLVASIRPDLIDRVFGTSLAPVAAAAAAPVEPQAAPRRLGEMLPYSVQVRAFPSFAAARDELTADQERVEAAPFFISPEEIQGIVYYRILSGLAPDTSSAIRLRDRLVEIGSIDEEDAVGAWSMIQFTPLAFDLGEYTSREEAAARADSLLVAEIPTYTAAVQYSDGSRRWQLYAGAYADSVSAMRMRDMLSAVGVHAPLSARSGTPATLPE